MTIGGSGQEGGGPREVSGMVTGVVVRYVREAAGDEGVARVLAAGGGHRRARDLEDPATWISHDEAVALLSASAEVTGDADIALHVGQCMIRQHRGTETAVRLRALGSPAELTRSLAVAANTFTTVSSLEPTEIGQDQAVLRSSSPPGLPRHPYFCDLAKGMLSEVPVLFGLPPAPVGESECQARGGRFCCYHVRWSDDARPPADARSVDSPDGAGVIASPDGAGVIASPDGAGVTAGAAGEARWRPGDLGERLSDAYTTAPDLLSDDDLSSRMERILQRAGDAVGATGTILVARGSDGAPSHLYRWGIADTEARRLAEAILQTPAGSAGADRLVVDVGSPRRAYGRLGAVFPAATTWTVERHQALSFYAAAAATALDLAASLQDARQSDDTARALLFFSRTLAGLGTARDVAQRLADTISAVVGGDESSVLLWDTMDQKLGVRARSRGAHRAAEPALPDPVGAGPPGGAPADATLVLTEPGAPQAPPEPELDSSLLERSPVVAALMGSRDVAVVDRTTQDAFVTTLLDRHGCEVAALFPLFSDDDFLGLVTAEFGEPPPFDLRTDHHLRDRLAGLADQAVIALQNALLVEQVGDQAWHDALTGLPNLRLLADRVEQELGRTAAGGEPPTLLYIDLDRMQRVNEALGHAAGDELIRQVAQRLRAAARDQDTVARLGNDKLAVLLVGLSDRIAVLQMAERMLESVRDPFHVAGAEIFTSASMGVAIAPRHGISHDELLASAADACRRSKQNGRNTHTLSAEDHGPGPADAELQAELRAELRDALDRDELFVLYQPFIDLQTTQVVGVEALVRWHHPTRGVLEPAAFILLAEETDLIVGIDLYVLREACRQMRRWADEGVTPLRMSVNVSARDLTHPGFVSSVVMALRDHGVPPEWLELEVTERVTVDEDGVMRRAAEQLRQLGVRFSLDDFGVGSASLQQMAAFPVTTLKIDRSFVQLLGPPDELTSLATAIIGLAEKLGLDCVAEGVETSRQSRVLLQRGCSTAQGFFFSPPLFPNDVKRMLQSPMRPTSRPLPPPDEGR